MGSVLEPRSQPQLIIRTTNYRDAHRFAVDAGKVNTRENGWRDLKIAVAQKRPAAEPATAAEWESRKLPAATARVMWADISATKRFRRSWHARLKRLGLPWMARLHVLGDGASWIWKAADRALTGCRQTLDIYHAGQHIAKAGKRLFGEPTAEATAFHERGRDLLLKEGWTGICRLIGEELEREDTPKRRRILDRLLSYFLSHMQRLDYAGRLASELVKESLYGHGLIDAWPNQCYDLSMSTPSDRGTVSFRIS